MNIAKCKESSELKDVMVLLQEGLPVAYIARCLTKAEANYSAIEKEFLAFLFCLERLHFYTVGRRVKILTDHKPLLGLVKADFEKITPRLRRFVQKAFVYDLD